MFIKKLTITIFIINLIVINFSKVYAEEINNDSQIVEENNGLNIYSEAVILIEEKTGKILYEKASNERKYPASTTKILTAIIAIEKCSLDEKMTASYDAVNSIEKGYTKADIQVGETFTLEQLLNVLMLQSANEAANIIAEHISGNVSEFAKLMNEKAKEIGCTNSNFINANGIHSEEHYSTAHDMALIARYCMKNETFRSFANKMECSLPWTEFWQQEQVDEHDGCDRIFKNTNSLLREDNRYYYPYCIGIKTGFTTPAKNCLIAASNKDGFETIAVVLHAESTENGLSARYLDTINLFEYGYNNFNIDEILKEYNYTAQMSVETVAETTTEDIDSNTQIINSVEDIDNNAHIMNSNEIMTADNEEEEYYENFILIIVSIVLIVIAILLIIYLKIKKNYRGKHEKGLYRFPL